MTEEVGRTLVSVHHRLALFFPGVYRFPDPPLVHSVAFSVDQLGTVPVYDMVERDALHSLLVLQFQRKDNR